MTRVIMQYPDQFGSWRRFTEMHHEPSAYRTAVNRAKSTGKRHRLVDADGHLLDLVDP